MYKNNTVQAFCCFFYDKVIFCRRYNKAGGIIILLLFLSENIRSMKKILNNLLHRLKEDSLNKRVGNSTREVEYKEKREIKTCLECRYRSEQMVPEIGIRFCRGENG